MESNTNYLFIDDDNQSALITKIELSTKRLKIKLEPPMPFDTMLDTLSKKNFRYQGLIFDLRLNEQRQPNQKFAVNYRPTAIVQEIRSRAAESGNLASEFPIVLLSDESNISGVYQKDKSSHGLFDMVFSKDEVSNYPKIFGTQLLSLANGYQKIIALRSNSKATPLDRFLAGSKGVIIDPRIIHNFDSKEWRVTAHEYTNFILRQVIQKQGALIDEKILAARLGVNIDQSQDWGKLKTKLRSTKYEGVFSDGWPCWWASSVENWWDSLNSNNKGLRDTSAVERVEIIKAKFNLKNLIAAKPFDKEYSDFFWTICKSRQLPLDPANGFIINSDEPKAWQDREYISGIAAIRKEKGIKVHPIEIPRLKLLLKKTAHVKEKSDL